MTETKPQQTQKKALQMEKVSRKIETFTASPLYGYRKQNNYHAVTGEGDLDAEIMFIGEAPGKREAETGRPFVGRAGKFLDSLLEMIGLDRQDVYITNIVKDRPPKNRIPRSEEIQAYAPFLLQQIQIIQPQLIAPLGRFATYFILKTFEFSEHEKTIGELHGQFIETKADYGRIKILPLYHPAAIFYNRDLEEKMKIDFQKIQQEL